MSETVKRASKKRALRILICKACSSEFEGKPPSHFCDACREQRGRDRYKGKEEREEQCQNIRCGKYFITTYTRSRFCSPECKNGWWSMISKEAAEKVKAEAARKKKSGKVTKRKANERSTQRSKAKAGRAKAA